MVEHAAGRAGFGDPHEGFLGGVHLPGPTRGWLLGIASAALAGGVGVAVLAARSRHLGVDPALIGLGLLTGWSFVASGLVALRRRPENRFGWLLVGCGFAWYAGALPAASWSPLFTFGLLVSPIWAAVFVHTILAFPSGRVGDQRLARAAVGVAYGGFVLLQIPYVVVGAPDRQFDCPCPDNLLLVSDNRDAAGLINLLQLTVAGVLVAAMVVFVLVRRWRAASPPLRRVLGPFLATGSATLLLLVFGEALAGVGLDPLNPVVMAAFVGLAAIPLAFLVGLLRSRLARAGVADLVLALRRATTASDVQAAVSRALGDPSLVLAYWVPDEERYVSAEGGPLELPRDGGRGVQMVERDGERVAALVYDESLEDEPELIESVAATAAMALQNVRLQAEARAHLAELRASRARIVEAGDEERRRLERDLHDGAQQRFVTLSLAMSVVEKRLESDPTEAGQLLTEARKELAEGLHELRELARGIHPAVLTQSGLGIAVETLAARSPVPVTLDVALHDRLPEPVEIAGYFVISEALTNVAKYAEASAVIVALACTDDTLVVEVRDDGVGGARADAGSGLRGLADRVDALGGRFSVRSPAGKGTAVRAEIPCA
jgi:signal transduction histidine kinase